MQVLSSSLQLTPGAGGGPDSHDLLILIPALALVSFVASGFAVWAFRRNHLQHARAELLADNLSKIREETHRRLNFLNAISHDLRTQLNGIALQTHIIEKAMDSNKPEMLHQAVGEVRSSSTLAAEILDALLQYARVDLDENTIRPVPVKELITQTAEGFRAAAEEKNLSFLVAVEEEMVLHTDRTKLQRIVANLLDNAVKFTHNGSIVVKASRRTGPVPAAHCHPRPQWQLFSERWSGTAEHCLIEVIDTGEGIAPAHLPKIFREFFQANNPGRDARQGLGLGLVIAERLTQQLGGSLGCESELKKGTAMRVALPIGEPELDAC